MTKKVALITGSTRGIGYAIALELAKNNYIPILNSRSALTEHKSLLKELKKIEPKSSIYYFDVTDFEAVTKSVYQIIKDYGQISVLVNNAGITNDKTVIKMTPQEWDVVIKTNLYGPFYLSKAVLPNMVENSYGRIINISSIIGLVGNFGQSNYSASKAGILALTKSLSLEVAKYNITVNAICPGFTATEMVKKIPQNILEERIFPKLSIKRLARPEEIAKLANYLASEAANYITGEHFNINGGWW